LHDTRARARPLVGAEIAGRRARCRLAPSREAACRNRKNKKSKDRSHNRISHRGSAVVSLTYGWDGAGKHLGGEQEMEYTRHTKNSRPRRSLRVF